MGDGWPWQSAVDVSVVAGIGSVEVDDALFEENQTLRGLESGSGRVGAHQCAVEKRLVFIVDQIAVVFATLAAHESARRVGGA